MPNFSEDVRVPEYQKVTIINSQKKLITIKDGGHEIDKTTFCGIVGKSQNDKNSKENRRKAMKTESELVFNLLINTGSLPSGKTSVWGRKMYLICDSLR